MNVKARENCWWVRSIVDWGTITDGEGPMPISCASCGLLALRKSYSTFIEASLHYRVTGNVDPGTMLSGTPMCFEMMSDLAGETENADDVKTVTQRDRWCTSHTEWTQGFSPMEHRVRAERRQADLLATLARDHERKWRLVEVSLFVAAGAITAIIAALIERGSI